MAHQTPQDLESEQSILGACLMEREAVLTTVGLLTVHDFYRQFHQKIYGAIVKLFDQKDSINIVTVPEELRRLKQLEECGGIDYLMSLTEACPSATRAEQYARIVQEKSFLRQSE